MPSKLASRIWIIILSAVCVGVAAFSAVCITKKPSSHVNTAYKEGMALVPGKQEIDAGEVISGIRNRYEFTIANPGTTPITVGDFTASCACEALTRISRKVIAPGENSVVSMVFSPHLGYEGNVHGSSVVATSNGMYEVVVSGKCITPVKIAKLENNVVDFGKVSEIKGLKVAFSLTPGWTINSTKGSEDVASCAIQGSDLLVDLQPGISGGMFGQLTMSVTSPERKECVLAIPIMAATASDIDTVPSSKYLGIGTKDQAHAFKFSVTNKGGGTIVINEINLFINGTTTKSDWKIVKNDGSSIQGHISLPNEALVGDYHGYALVRCTTDKGPSQDRIFFYGRISN